MSSLRYINTGSHAHRVRIILYAVRLCPLHGALPSHLARGLPRKLGIHKFGRKVNNIEKCFGDLLSHPRFLVVLEHSRFQIEKILELVLVLHLVDIPDLLLIEVDLHGFFVLRCLMARELLRLLLRQLCRVYLLGRSGTGLRLAICLEVHPTKVA